MRLRQRDAGEGEGPFQQSLPSRTALSDGGPNDPGNSGHSGLASVYVPCGLLEESQDALYVHWEEEGGKRRFKMTITPTGGTWSPYC